MFRIEPVNHRESAIAKRVHAVLKLAYTQEAALLQIRDFAPLDRSVEDLMASDAYFLGAMDGDELIGALILEADNEVNQLNISALVIHPKYQRRGAGSLLVNEALRRGSGMVFSVSTAQKNAPALALYERLGFLAYRYGVIGPEEIALVKLRKSAP